MLWWSIRLIAMNANATVSSRLLTARQVALVLNISSRAIPRLIRNGQLKAINLGPRIKRFQAEDIARLISQTKGVSK